MRILRFILGDQLSRTIASLDGLDRQRDVVLMTEVYDECTYVPHHPKKIAFILSAMRHFAEALKAEGVTVDYRPLDDPANTGSFRGELLAAVRRHRPDRIVVTEPGEWRVRRDTEEWPTITGVPIDVRPDNRFICTTEEFARWAAGRRQLRMEYFYREMRRKTGLLMTPQGTPEGDQWNFDAHNRKRLPQGERPPPPLRFAPDPITAEVIDLVSRRFSNHFGDLTEFGFGVTADDADHALAHFVANALARYGDYQDAMKEGDPTLYHSVLALYLNAGLLDPLTVCRRVEAAYRMGRAPLNAAEGFIRQVIGWREYVRGIYWSKMPDYAETNFFAATRPLPSFYWSGETPMNCVRQCIQQTRDEAYAHHIQRLMVTGLFALLAGIAPKEVCAWYLSVYADAFEWVELPNTHGMALYADGGLLASKPYAASGKYIDRMSDYCRHCVYDVSRAEGVDACPFNLLYWSFLAEHRNKLSSNPRLGMIYKTMDRMGVARIGAIRKAARAFCDTLT